MGTQKDGYRRPKGFHYVPDAGEVSSGIVEITTTSKYDSDTEAVVAMNVKDSSGVVKTNEAKVTYSSGVVTIQNNSGFTLATGDEINMLVTYV